MRRLMLNVSRSALADELGLTSQQIQKYERGANRVNASRLQQLSRILEVPVPFFFEGLPFADDKSRKVPPSRYVSDLLSIADSLALTAAFTQISDPAVRRSIVEMVEALANASR